MLNTIVEIIATILDVVFLIWFIPKFNRTSIKEKRWTIIFPAIALIIQFTADWFKAGFAFLPSIIFILLSAVYSLTMCRGNYFRALLATSLYNVTSMMVAGVLYLVLSYVINDFDTLLQGAYSVSRVLYLVIAKILLFGLLKFILLIFKSDNSFDLKTGFIAFGSTILSVIGLTAIIDIVSKSSNSATLPSIIILTVIVLVNMALYFLIYHIQKLLKLKYELKLTKERMAFESEKIKEAHIIWDNIQKVRHDIKNHLTVISGQLDCGMIDDCKEYIKKLAPSINSMGNLIRSNNSVADYIINSKLSNLSGIDFLIVGNLGTLKNIEDTDIACIIGNIIDNAVEAQNNVTGKKKIELAFSRVGGYVSIVCKNTVEKSVLKNNSDLKTTKNDGKTHGMGHKIVENAVKKYGGIVEYFEEENIFGVHILLPE